MRRQGGHLMPTCWGPLLAVGGIVLLALHDGSLSLPSGGGIVMPMLHDGGLLSWQGGGLLLLAPHDHVLSPPFGDLLLLAPHDGVLLRWPRGVLLWWRRMHDDGLRWTPKSS